MHLTDSDENAVGFLMAMDQLVEMGYKREHAEEALVVCNRDASKAIDYLAKM